MALFTVENLSFTYPGQTAPAIDRLTLTRSFNLCASSMSII